jgi:predicted transcriptional regulator
MMQNVFWLDTIELLEILANPIRVEIIDQLRFKPYSPMRLSKVMNVSAQKLNYHFKLLYQSGLIYKKYEERKRGAFESYYQPIAHMFKIDDSIFNENVENFSGCFSQLERIAVSFSEQLNEFPKSFDVESLTFEKKQDLIDNINCSGDEYEFHLIKRKKLI